MAFEIERLYGVIHATSITHALLGTVTHGLRLKPSPELLEDLAKLPAGTKVGIEEHPPGSLEDKMVIDGIKVSHDRATHLYWKAVDEHCKKHSLDVIYLDDPKMWKEIAALRVKATRPGKELRRTRGKKRVQLEKKEAYLVDAEIDYKFEHIREQQLLERIAELKPKVVLLGLGHTNIIYDRFVRGLMQDFKIKEYAAEELPDLSRAERDIAFHLSEEIPIEDFDAELISEKIQPNGFNRQPGTDHEEVARRESVIRKWRAITAGRVTDKNPDYIGTWDFDIEPRGLFEVFMRSRKKTDFGERIEGAIEDCLGGATFEGQVEGKTITFIKEYTRALSASAARGAIHYKGKLNANGEYEGQYDVEGYRGGFRMKEFRKSETTQPQFP